MEDDRDLESDDMQENEFLNDQNNAGFDQEVLTQEEKDEVVTKSLTANNPQAGENITQYSWKDNLFKKDEFMEHLVIHFAFDGDLVLKETDEARD